LKKISISEKNKKIKKKKKYEYFSPVTNWQRGNHPRG
jgi:hypothetical protein